ncbi:GumC family protein [Neptunicoccus cionae]|uniref:GumC family protein n=1 Tax=Neptunicoccus cionae TaxID=2035344 RepID=UPI000C766D88|nr:polysaccharide biosynthesis tyrosine autokinase [Amylibacter cionae]PLS20825.1 hypothetical protein C0U40_14480 [Amylibacter cionae]
MYNRKPPFEDGFFPMKRIGSDDRDMVDLKQLAQMIWRRRNLIILSTLVFGVLAYVLVSQITPTYSAESKVMLDPRKSQVTIGEDVVSDLDINDQLVLSEAAVIKSNLLIEEVIAEIGFSGLAILDPAHQPPGLKDRVKTVARGLGLMKTPEPPTPEQALRSKIETLVYVIRKNLSVRREGKSFVISITAKTESPQLSALLAQTIAEKYIEQQLENRQNVAKQATAWIEERLKILRKELEEAQAAGVRSRMANLQADGTSLQAISQQLFELTTKLSEAQGDRTIAEASLNQLEVIVAEQGVRKAGTLLTSPQLEVLNAERVKLTIEDGVWARNYDAEHPSRKRLRSQIDVIEAEMVAEVEKIIEQKKGEVQLAQARERSIQSNMEQMQQRMIAISTNELDQEELQRKVNSARLAYEQLLNRLTETRSQEQLQKADARIIEQATVPGSPSAPKPKLIAVLGAMLGMAVGFGATFYLGFASKSYRSEDDIEADTGLPVLASLQAGEWDNPVDSYLDVMYAPNSEYAERIRQLRTSVLMHLPAGKTQKILVTSSTPDEGKTTTTLNLAAMIAKTGKSVILVDCDLRRSGLAAQFGWDMKFGLSDYLERACDLDQAVYSDTHMPFDILTSNGAHAQTVDALGQDKLAEIMDLLEQSYDVIIIDSPPVLAVADGLMLARAVDSLVFVVRWNETPKQAVKKALGMLGDARARPSGLVFNMVDPKEYLTEFVGGYAYEE